MHGGALMSLADTAGACDVLGLSAWRMTSRRAEGSDDGADGGLAEPAGHLPGLDGRPGEVVASALAGRGQHVTFRP